MSKTFWHRWGQLIAATLAVLAVVSGIAFTTTARNAAQASSGRIVISFWHSMNGPNGQLLDKIVDNFNQSQTKYKVVSQYEGSYGLAESKYINTLHTNVTPTIMQQSDIPTMTAVGDYVPIQQFADADHYDLNQFYPGILSGFKLKGKLQSMPFNASSSVMYYNKDLFKKYGVKPLSKSPSYSEIRAAAKALTEKSKGAVKGATLQIYPWLPEQLAANQNAVAVNKDNGRTAAATSAELNTPAMQRTFAWVQNMIKDGSFQNYGTGSSASANQMAGFLAGKIGIFMQSSAAAGTIAKGAKFKWGETFTAHADGVPANGVAAGGASLWISKDKSKAEQQGAWEFIKYAMEAKQQAAWQIGTGYIAVNKASVKTAALQAAIKKNPDINVPIEQLQAGKVNAATAGPFLVNSQMDQYLGTAMQQIYGGKDIKQSLQEAQDEVNKGIRDTNKNNAAILKSVFAK